ncbi:MAG: sugar phosphate nucleotidyltransferase [Clostridium sp.]
MRAILLAAGMGTRLRPLTLDTPKSLIEVNEKPLAERQIEYLIKNGITDITVVTGYLSEKFEYLKEKFGVNIVFNDKYDKYNNIYTMYLVRNLLEDCYVIDADIYINRDFIDGSIKDSTYFSAYKEGFKDEWELKFNDNEVLDIVVGSGNGYILSGVSYWSASDAKIIVNELENAINSGDFKNLYWDDIVKNNLSKLNVKIEKLNSDDVFEIDSIEELNEVNRYLESKKNV